jgi:hypothetical protein
VCIVDDPGAAPITAARVFALAAVARADRPAVQREGRLPLTAGPDWSVKARVAFLIGVVLVCAAGAAVESPSIATVKAAFVFNFANFAEWPVDVLPSGHRLSLCVVNDDEVANALTQISKGRTIKGHAVTVERVEIVGAIRTCHVVYASVVDGHRAAELLEAVRGAAVLTVSDGDRFAESGGIVQLIVENERMRFAINASAAERARIRLSSKLLNLARMVRDEH